MAITIKNMSSSMVSLYVPSIRFNRELPPGRVVPLSKEEYEELMYDSGVLALINGHYLKVEGVEEDKQVAVETSPAFDVAAINAMFEKNDITGFAKFIPHATEAEKETVVRLAVDKGITSPAFVALIKKYCDVDIINAINIKHQSEEK